jgi:hypothetical protein
VRHADPATEPDEQMTASGQRRTGPERCNIRRFRPPRNFSQRNLWRESARPEGLRDQAELSFSRKSVPDWLFPRLSNGDGKTGIAVRDFASGFIARAIWPNGSDLAAKPPATLIDPVDHSVTCPKPHLFGAARREGSRDEAYAVSLALDVRTIVRDNPVGMRKYATTSAGAFFVRGAAPHVFGMSSKPAK